MKWLLLSFVILIVGNVPGQLLADPADAPTPIKSGDTVLVGDAKCAVRIIDADNRISRTEDGCIACWEDGTITVFDPVRGTQEKDIACPWPLQTLSNGRNWAVVFAGQNGGIDHLAIANLKTQKLLAALPEDSDPVRWSFTENYAVPVFGSGRFVAVDLQTGKLVNVPVPKGMRGSSSFFTWSGWVGDDGMSMIGFFSEEGSSSRLLANVDLSHPEKSSFKASELAGFNKLIGHDHLLAFLSPKLDKPVEMAIVAKGSWEIGERFALDSDRARMLLGTPTPGGSESWYVDSLKGTTIYDAKNGKVIAQAPGKFANAYSLKVIFGNGGKVALIAEPYEGVVSVLSTADHRVIQRFAVDAPAGAMVLQPGKDGKRELVIFQTKLPYE